MIIMDENTIEEVKTCKVIDIGTFSDIEELTDKINELVMKISGADTTMEDEDVDLLSNVEIDD